MGKLNIAIDGPAGAGKSTVAKQVAAKLGLMYIDTGAMYRALTLKAISQGTDFSDESALSELAARTEINLTRSPDGPLIVYCDDQDVTEEIRSPAVSEMVSKLATSPGVRQRMVALQQKMAARGGVIMDGRDIGTCVMPNADYKFFLTASLAERAKRRWLELQRDGYNVDLKVLEEQIAVRDQRDASREVAPLKAAPDAQIVDTEGLTIEQVVDKIVGCCTKDKAD